MKPKAQKQFQQIDAYQPQPGAFIVFASLGLVSLMLLVANIVASQLVYPPLMFRLMSLTDAQAPREFLADLDPNTPLYRSQKKYLNSIYNNIFDEEANINALNNEKAIDHYTKLLLLSPNNPQLHVKLGLLYKVQGSPSQAVLHFQRAQEIDPWIKTE